MSKNSKYYIGIISVYVMILLSIIVAVVHFGGRDRLPKSTIQSIPMDESRNEIESPNEERVDIKTAFINGDTFDQDGRIYPQASVIASSRNTAVEIARSVESDRYGRFSIELPIGDYIVSATAADAIETVTEEVSLHSESNGSVKLFLSREKSIQFIIVNEERRPVPAVNLSLYAAISPKPKKAIAAPPSYNQISIEGISDSSGTVCLKSLVPGSYYLIAQASGYVDCIKSKLTTECDRVEIVLKRDAELLCYVSDQRNEPVFNASVRLQKLDGSPIDLSGQQTSQIGKCVFSHLSKGTYKVSCSHPECNIEERSQAELYIHKDRQEITLVLNRKGFQISGYILTQKDRSPVPNFTLGLFDRAFRPGQTPVGVSKSDSNGLFQFNGVLPGLYRIESVRRDNYDLGYRIISSVNGIPVTLKDEDVNDIEILAYPLASISGHVYDREKQPVPNAYVCSEDFETQDVRTDESGYYHVRSLYFDKPNKNGVVVFAYHPDYGWGSSQGVYYSPGDDCANVDVVLGGDGGVPVTGTVVDTDSKPIEHAYVEYSTLNFPAKTFHVNNKGRYKIDNAMNGFFLVASATGYQSERRLCHYRYDDKSAKNESFRLSSTKEEQEISGVVIDENGNPMPLVTVEALLYEEKMRYPIDVVQTKTDAQGFFVVKKAISGRYYQLFASCDRAPYYKKQINGVLAGSKGLVIILDTLEIELKIELDRRGVSDILKDESVVTIDVVSSDYLSPKITRLWKVAEIPQQDPIPVQSDDYCLACVNWQNESYDVYGQQYITIDRNTQNPYPVTIELHASPIDENVMVIGKCIYPDGETFMEKYRVVCRKYQNQGIAKTQETTAPWTEDGIYNLMIRESGVYEFIYITYEGVLFNRSLYEINSESAEPWNGVPTIRFPDVVIQNERLAR